MKQTKNENIPPQELNKYNRASGRYTLLFMESLIALIVILSVVTLFQFI